MSRTATRVITLPRGRDDSLLAIPYGAEPGSTPAKQKEAEPEPRVSLSVSLSLPGPSLSLPSDHVRCRCRRRRRWRRRRRLSSAAKDRGSRSSDDYYYCGVTSWAGLCWAELMVLLVCPRSSLRPQ